MDGWRMDIGSYIIRSTIPSCSTRPRLADREHQDNSRWAGLVFGLVLSRVFGLDHVKDGRIDIASDNAKSTNTAEKARIKNKPKWLNVLNQKIKTNSQFESHQPKMKTKTTGEATR